ncbi:MAG: hypothetical protein IT175_05225 [Acidobacteria bacterium]|nr:hypothetical protein [Acidobacteriota bacterium]
MSEHLLERKGIFRSFPPFADIHQQLRTGKPALGVAALIVETRGVRRYWHSLAVVCVLVSLIASGIVPACTAKGAGCARVEYAIDDASSRPVATGGTPART